MIKPYDVFISRKSADAPFSKKIYDYLTAEGLNVFESDESLQKIGNSDYSATINQALATSTHMIVIGSSIEYIQSSWVQSEWSFFLNRKRSGKTSGNIITVIASSLKLEELPPTLSHYEVIPYNEKNFPRLYNYVRAPNTPAKQTPKELFPPEKQNTFLWAIVGVLAASILAAYIYISSQPFDATFFLKPHSTLNLQNDYPPFKGGELSVFIDNKEEKEQILANGEVSFKQLPASSEGKKVAVQLHANYWKTAVDSIRLDKQLTLKIIPYGSLSIITGNIRTPTGKPIDNVRISVVNNDTTFLSDNTGSFRAKLPVRLQRYSYELHFEKDGFQPCKEIYYPKSENIDVVMKALAAH